MRTTNMSSNWYKIGAFLFLIIGGVTFLLAKQQNLSHRFPVLSEIVKFPDPRLRKKANPVVVINKQTELGIQNMFRIMERE